MMNIKNNVFLILLLCYALNITAQSESVYRLLTHHQGYWLLYSERIEQCQNGDCIAKETFAHDEMPDAIMFDTDGVLHAVTTMNGFSQTESRWKVDGDHILTLIMEEDYAQMEILELTESRLVLKYAQERPDGLWMAKISTYCFPDSRLSEEEAASLNERGVFEIDVPTTRSGNRVHAGPDSLLLPLTNDIERYRIFQPSENSAYVGRLFIFDYFMKFILRFPFETARLLPAIHWEGIKDLTVSAEEEEKLIFHCDTEGNILYIDEEEEKVLRVEYENKVPVSFHLSGEEFDCYTGANFFLVESKDRDTQIFYETNEQRELIKRRFQDNYRTLNFTNEFFNESTKKGYSFESLDCGDVVQVNSFCYTNKGAFPFDIKYERRSPFFATDVYQVDKNGNVISIKVCQLAFTEEGEGLELSHEYRVHLNERENIQKIECLKEGGRTDTLFFAYSYY